MLLPKEFLAKVAGAFGEAGGTWLERLPEKIEEYADKWKLEIEGPAGNLSYNYVAKARDENGRPVILKLGVPHHEFINEIRAIKMYNGEGCARLLKEDGENGAMLLEQLIPGRNLAEIEDEKEVVRQYLNVWKAIRRPLPAGHRFPAMRDWSLALVRYLDTYPNGDGPIGHADIRKAMGYFQELNDPEQDELLHGDLHHENILNSETRGWLAIDPKGVAGNPTFDLISFLFNHLHGKPDPRGLLLQRIEWLCKGLSLNKEKLLKAGFAMSTLSACWSIEDNSDWEETYRCGKWFEEILQKGN
ncbi:aminoglycoside/hydroxyurea antibiotic resistance kinase [Neobacillus notoginsengisoli]|uniref:Aminoglycoside/hydroxyurea antibiotic resistance kinase n=1 Tax=Neobacillus notoginsengisoli TaxID=1578198 RepID=A0A417YS40_9BACI|nr:aminoglycoside phosphotransferase family protein [Neobacillus notoginsengisoli]RHW38105.1 aminoglycoside/hydroxyurea antibiotic resistance kinase [Neobacillus notoginsengisoli]